MLFNLEDWENIIHFGNLFASIGKKTYFLALGTTPVTGVGFIARKITVNMITCAALIKNVLKNVFHHDFVCWQ